MIICIVLYFFLMTQALYTCDNAHFYRATYFWGEPRLEKPWLSTIECSPGGGSTSSARNSNGKKTPLLNVLGPHAMQQLGADVPNLDPANPIDAILINLYMLPERKNFGDLVFSGKFRAIEMPMNYYQNFINGFFAQAYVPIRSLRIKRIAFDDLSPNDAVLPNKNTPEWQFFLKNFGAILSRFNISMNQTERTGIGDLTILGGWTSNYENTVTLDYVDVTGKIGILFPTGKTRNNNIPFDLPLGYNGHFAVPLHFDISCGALEWLTVGLHLSALFFFKKTEKIRIKTDFRQNGFIKLAQTSVCIEPGNLYNRMAYVKADHIVHGFSFIAGYSFDNQEHAALETNNYAFDNRIINSDSYYKGWSMHTMHFILECDFTRKNDLIGPRLALFYNRVIGGKRVFNTSVVGGYCGLEIACQF